MTLYPQKYDDLKQDVEILKKNEKGKQATKQIKEIADENKEELEELKQYTRRNNLLFDGVPEAQEEDTYSLVIEASKALGVALSGDDIDVVHRLPSRRRVGPRRIIAKLTNRWKRDLIADAMEKKGILRAREIGYEGPDCNIYVNDHLTPRNDTLAKKCRDLRKEEKIHSTRSRYCKIQVKIKKGGKWETVNGEAGFEELVSKLE